MANRITSVQNPRVKDSVRLRGRRGREEQQRIVIDGSREIARALQAGVQIIEVFAPVSALSELERGVLAKVEQTGAIVYDASPTVMNKLAYGDRDAGLVAVAHTPQCSLQQLSVPEDAIVAVLERVEKPGNLGAVVRSADAARVSAVFVADGGTDLYNPNAIRASAGTIFGLPVISTTATDALSWLRSGKFRIFATRVDGTRCYWNASLTGRIAVVLGSESTGLSDVWAGPDIQSISIPQYGVADSLNVSVTAAILFYEALRQREPPGVESATNRNKRK